LIADDNSDVHILKNVLITTDSLKSIYTVFQKNAPTLKR